MAVPLPPPSKMFLLEWPLMARLSSILPDGGKTAPIPTRLDSVAECSKHMRERENAQIIACDFDIAASCLPVEQAGQRFFAFSKTMAKTTTKTV